MIKYFNYSLKITASEFSKNRRKITSKFQVVVQKQTKYVFTRMRSYFLFWTVEKFWINILKRRNKSTEVNLHEVFFK